MKPMKFYNSFAASIIVVLLGSSALLADHYRMDGAEPVRRVKGQYQIYRTSWARSSPTSDVYSFKKEFVAEGTLVVPVFDALDKDWYAVGWSHYCPEVTKDCVRLNLDFRYHRDDAPIPAEIFIRPFIATSNNSSQFSNATQNQIYTNFWVTPVGPAYERQILAEKSVAVSTLPESMEFSLTTPVKDPFDSDTLEMFVRFEPTHLAE
jgi:hypothetical protein